MTGFLKSFRGEAYALFRIIMGFLFAFHGTQKLLSFPSAAPPNLPDFIRYGAGPIELVGGLLIMIGFLTSRVSFEASTACR